MATKTLRVNRPAIYDNPGRPNTWPSTTPNVNVGEVGNVTTDGGPKKMRIAPVGESGGLNIPYAPRSVTLSDKAATWATVSRTGQSPLVVKETTNPDKMAFTLFFGSVEENRACTAEIKKLESYAALDVPLKIRYSLMEEGEWHISSLTFTSAVRRPTDHEWTQATAEVEFVRSTGGAMGVGPVTGGKGAGKSKDESGHTVEYKVKQGDTLHSIANKFFKDTSRWKDIARWNNISDPKKLKVGQILKIKLPGKGK
jgi:hypothetical protein